MSEYDVKITFTFDDYATTEQFNEWFKYTVFGWGACSENNPLLNKQMSEVVTYFRVD